MTSSGIIFFICITIALIALYTIFHKQNILDSLYIGMPVDAMHNGILSHGYIIAFNNKTVTIVLFDYPHALIERKITEINF